MQQMLFLDNVGYAELVLNESSNGSCRFKAKLQEANAVNKNRRMYTFDVLNSNIASLNEAIKNRGLYGELDHPSDSIVHLTNVSHLITKVWWEGNIMMGEGEILNTPSGKVLKALMEANGRIGMSSRGVGNGQTNEEGVMVIGESYKLITFDCVADPSCYAAFQTRIGESQEINTVLDKPTVNKSINSKAFTGFVGSLLESKLQEIKEKIRKK